MACMNKEITKAIRTALKKAFPQYRFSVRNKDFRCVYVIITSGPAFDIIKQKDGELLDINNRELQINAYSTYHYRDYYGKYSEFFSKIVEIIKTAPYLAGAGDLWYNKSDSQVDHFDTAYYINLSVGQWDKPYTAT